MVNQLGDRQGVASEWAGGTQGGVIRGLVGAGGTRVRGQKPRAREP